MTMAFDAKPTGGDNTQSNVDWDAMNKEIVDICGTQKKKRSLVGVVSGVIDLGEQPQPDSEVKFDGTPEQEAAEIAKNSNTYFKTAEKYFDNGKWLENVRLKCWPNKPRQSVAITVDFPQIMIDKGKYFGSSNPAPLRLLLNGEFTVNGERGLGRLFPITWEKLENGAWTIKRNTTLYKLAVAAGVVDDGEAMSGIDIPKLLGKAAQFEIQVKLNESNGRYFMNEKIKFAGVIPEGLPIPELDEKFQYSFEFDKENDEEVVRQMRASIKNTIKRANNYKGNTVQAQIEASEAPRTSVEASSGESNANPKGEAKKPVKNAPTKPQQEVDFDDDEDTIPF